ncbi:hypothetical protein GQ600_23749 [Phytophthora cactorum]|nr:hypothetical protein GQ600_23749 [Phytophthora cactorum]
MSVIGDGSEVVNWKAFSPPKSRQKTLSKPKLSRRPSLDMPLLLERSPSSQRADLNNAEEDPLSLCAKANISPLGRLQLARSAIFPERGEFVPTDYEVVRRRGVPANINTVRRSECAEIATITDTMLGVFKAEKNALQLVVTFSKAINRKFVSLSETATESDQRSSVNSLVLSTRHFLALEHELVNSGCLVKWFEALWTLVATHISSVGTDVLPTGDVASQPDSPAEHKRQASRKYGGNISVRMRNELQIHNQQLLKRAMEISSSKSLKKALEYLVAMNFIKDTPRSITSFLRIYHDFFDETEMETI